jgi:beta-mannosidase
MRSILASPNAMRPHSDAQVLRSLESGWQLASSEAGAIEGPAGLSMAHLDWREAVVPGTVAQSLQADLEGRHHWDDQDWWYRCTFSGPEVPGALSHHLRFDGLATLADVWINGTHVLSSRNMFRAYACDVSALLKASNELVIRFRALTPELAVKRPRPRWKTALVSAQNLRWVRTTVLGRMPGWTPALPPVGPWKGISLVSHLGAEVVSFLLRTGAEGDAGLLRLRAVIKQEASSAKLHVGDRVFEVGVEVRDGLTHLACDLRIADAPLWSPHTHGTPHLSACALEVSSPEGLVRFDCGRVGFKSVVLDRSEGRVNLRINGRSVFCRGACWTVNDIRSLTGTDAQLRHALQLAKDAGANMIRVGGTMVYERDAFYALCDELGLMVWQDFMFANMDYPFEDPAFRAEVDAEVDAQLQRLAPHPCVTVYCGGSEIQQQAAMLGLPPEAWAHAFLAEALPARCAALHPGIPYFPSSPCEGALPFHTATGITHYYGVGAYLRPLSDLKSAQVKFASECLAFSQVPEEEAFADLCDGMPVPHHPQWKAGVPRDHGSGWDFEDVRDHYLKTLYGVDPIALRSADLERYYALSRAVTGEVMAKTYAAWRTDGRCGGGLVWFYQDLRPGAGWGVLDSRLSPKAAYGISSEPGHPARSSSPMKASMG